MQPISVITTSQKKKKKKKKKNYAAVFSVNQNDMLTPTVSITVDNFSTFPNFFFFLIFPWSCSLKKLHQFITITQHLCSDKVQCVHSYQPYFHIYNTSKIQYFHFILTNNPPGITIKCEYSLLFGRLPQKCEWFLGGNFWNNFYVFYRGCAINF